MKKPLLQLVNLSKSFSLKSGLFKRQQHRLHALQQVNLSLNSGETLGLVGESGSGKSTLARTVMRLIEADSGEIWFDGENLLALSHKKMIQKRQQIQMIFQDPLDSLNARWTIGQIIAEPLVIQDLKSKKEINKEVDYLLERVGLSPAQKHQFPYEFSGGQRQRVGIARALALKPKLIVADEPVSALDVSIQAQILNLMVQLQAEMDLSFLFIAHDIHVIRFISDHIAVMYMGRIVETGTMNELSTNPIHPYTIGLWKSVPSIDSKASPIEVIKGEVPSLIHTPTGCAFHPRCPVANKSCIAYRPELKHVIPGHWVACPVQAPQ